MKMCGDKTSDVRKQGRHGLAVGDKGTEGQGWTRD